MVISSRENNNKRHKKLGEGEEDWRGEEKKEKGCIGKFEILMKDMIYILCV
jgi:hypothetical protein